MRTSTMHSLLVGNIPSGIFMEDRFMRAAKIISFLGGVSTHDQATIKFPFLIPVQSNACDCNGLIYKITMSLFTTSYRAM